MYASHLQLSDRTAREASVVWPASRECMISCNGPLTDGDCVRPVTTTHSKSDPHISSAIVMSTPTDGHTSLPASSAASHTPPPSSLTANDPVTRGSSKRRREETKENEVEVNESSVMRVERPLQSQSSSLEEMKSDPSAAVALSSSPTVMDDEAAADGVIHIDKRARVEDGHDQQTRSGDQLMVVTVYAAPLLMGASAESSSLAAVDVSGASAAADPSSPRSPLMAPPDDGECSRREFFSHDEAAPKVVRLLNRIVTYAWNHTRMARETQVALILELLHRIDTNDNRDNILIDASHPSHSYMSCQ
jgi:hypothetical protein